jgi:hypothetical protein
MIGLMFAGFAVFGNYVNTFQVKWARVRAVLDHKQKGRTERGRRVCVAEL